MAIIKSNSQFTNGLSSTYPLTSAYATFGTMPGTGASLVFEVIQSSTSVAQDFRLVYSITGTSGFTYAATTYEQQTCSFYGRTTKQCHTFALQAQESTASTTGFDGTVQVRWISIQ